MAQGQALLFSSRGLHLSEIFEPTGHMLIFSEGVCLSEMKIGGFVHLRHPEGRSEGA